MSFAHSGDYSLGGDGTVTPLKGPETQSHIRDIMGQRAVK